MKHELLKTKKKKITFRQRNDHDRLKYFMIL